MFRFHLHNSYKASETVSDSTDPDEDAGVFAWSEDRCAKVRSAKRTRNSNRQKWLRASFTPSLLKRLLSTFAFGLDQVLNVQILHSVFWPWMVKWLKIWPWKNGFTPFSRSLRILLPMSENLELSSESWVVSEFILVCTVCLFCGTRTTVYERLKCSRPG